MANTTEISNAQRVSLFKSNVTTGAYSAGIRRAEYIYNAIQAWMDSGAGTIAVEACISDDSPWVQIVAPTAAPCYLVIPPGPYWGIRVKRNAGTDPISASILSWSPRS